MKPANLKSKRTSVGFLMPSTMNRALFLGFIAVLLLPAVGFAVPNITVSEDSHDIDAYVPTEEYFTFWVNNTGDEEAFMINFAGMNFTTFSDDMFNLSVNGSKLINATMSISEPFQGDVGTTLEYYRKEVVEETDPITNNTYLRDVFIHNSEFDITITAGLNASWYPAVVGLDLHTPYRSLNLNQIGEGVMTVSNPSAHEAKGVWVNCSFCVFDEADKHFDLGAGQERIISFHAIYNVTTKKTSLTNQTYSCSLNVSGENFATVDDVLYISVPYTEYVDDPEQEVFDSETYWSQKAEFCEDYPSSPLCVQEPETVEVEKVIYKDATVTKEYTEEELEELDSALKEVPQILQKDSNKLKVLQEQVEEQDELMGERLEELEASLQREREKSGELLDFLEESEKERGRTTRIGTIVVVFMLVVYLVTKFVRWGYRKWIAYSRPTHGWRLS